MGHAIETATGYTRSPAPDGPTDLNVQVDVPAVRASMLDALKGAKHTIDMDMFGLLPDGTGGDIAQLLRDKVKEGVSVNVSVDQAGSFVYPLTPFKRFIDGLQADGVNIIVSSRLGGRKVPAMKHVEAPIHDPTSMTCAFSGRSLASWNR